LVLFFFVVPSAVFTIQKGSVVAGCQQNWNALTAWVDKMIVPYVVHGEVTSERENQSLPGVLTRMLTPEPSFSKWVENQKVPLAYHNVAELDRWTVKRVVTGCQALFLILMVVLCRSPVRANGSKPADVRRGWRLAAEYSLILVGMLLFSERTWKHHCVTLILPFAVLSYGAFAAGFPRHVRLGCRITLFAGAAMILLPTAAEAFGDMTLTNVGTVAPNARELLKLNPNSPRELAQVYGSYLWGLLILLVGLCVMLASKKEEASGAALAAR
jgi:hypothetical protein